MAGLRLQTGQRQVYRTLRRLGGLTCYAMRVRQQETACAGPPPWRLLLVRPPRPLTQCLVPQRIRRPLGRQALCLGWRPPHASADAQHRLHLIPEPSAVFVLRSPTPALRGIAPIGATIGNRHRRKTPKSRIMVYTPQGVFQAPVRRQCGSSGSLSPHQLLFTFGKRSQDITQLYLLSDYLGE